MFQIQSYTGKTSARKVKNVDEDSRPNPTDVIGSTKLCAEILAQTFSSTFKVPITISRSTELFGPWQSEGLLPILMFSPFIKNALVCVTKVKQQMTYIDDHSKAIIDIIENGKSGKIYDITSRSISDSENYIMSEYDVATIIHESLDDSYALPPIELIPATDFTYSQILKGESLRKECCFKDRESTLVHDIKATINWYKENGLIEKADAQEVQNK